MRRWRGDRLGPITWRRSGLGEGWFFPCSPPFGDGGILPEGEAACAQDCISHFSIDSIVDFCAEFFDDSFQHPAADASAPSTTMEPAVEVA
jgi:hypothetical protein